MIRRKYLGIGVGSILSIVGGCTGSIPSNPMDQEFDPTDHVEDWQKEDPARGQGEPLLVEQHVTSPEDESCAREARDQLQDWVLDHVDQTSSLIFGYGSDQVIYDDQGEDRTILTAGRNIILTRDEEIKTTPDITFDTLQRNTPSEVQLTLTSENDEQICEFPVYIRDVVDQEM